VSEPLLVAENLVKTYGGGVRAVDGVSFTVAPGETVGIVGESGCGKSTTARMALRLLDADSGNLRFGDTDLSKARGKRLRGLRKRLQFVPQHPQTSFNPRLTVGASIAFNLTVHGWDAAKAKTRAGELLEQVGLGASYATRRPSALSGGQLQRAAIARALATDPELVICDEAVSALDKSVQAQVLNLLARLQRDTGVAFLFITHDLSVVEHISDRVLVMNKGKIVEEGPAKQVWSEPRDSYTRTLLAASPERIAGRIGGKR
jgi:ABC-type glutathione transport system ATPase component